ncbi:ABC transporter substrate-binding protein [Paenibacillus arenosi]|uniref:ABC transporter substrate-binding protein n=1 Tax=Paenibacillus arenosi TaxID=2774142 RepID=A0ABR9AY69_9BACL|nr:ABC transporter substrate-binding protein [Paenibacillus arenosi]MBD8498957.1 ABC transporter substrate-binding protein [Paenibacillus arenosi]
MNNKRLSGWAVCAAILLLLTTACGEKAKDAASGQQQGGANNADKVSIGITQIVQHTSLDEARKGFIQALKDNGYEEGVNLEIDYKDAQNDINNTSTIAQKFASDNKDLVLAISTPSAQAAAQQIKDVPILFTAVTDPVGGQLVSSMEQPGGNVTGTTDLHPEAISTLMEFVKTSIPNAKAVGIIANEGEQNTVTNITQAREALEKQGLEVVVAPITNSSEVKQAAESLIGKVQAIYVPSDNTVVSSLSTVVAVANEQDIPLFVAEKDSVKNGGVASFGFEYYDIGYATGEMAVDILKNGKKPADMPVQVPKELDLALNMKSAAEQGFTVTDDMKKSVKKGNLFE